MKFILVLLISIFFSASMEVWGADWKYFGASVLSKTDQVFVYFDNESVEYLSNGNVRVWTKAVIPSEVERMIGKEEVIEKTAQKVANGYSPPYILANPNPQTSFDEYMELIGWEEAANHSEIKPKGRFLFEINCKEKMSRYLSGSSFRNDGSLESSTRTPQEWGYISPETNSYTLHKILCKGRR